VEKKGKNQNVNLTSLEGRGRVKKDITKMGKKKGKKNIGEGGVERNKKKKAGLGQGYPWGSGLGKKLREGGGQIHFLQVGAGEKKEVDKRSIPGLPSKAGGNGGFAGKKASSKAWEGKIKEGEEPLPVGLGERGAFRAR